MSDLSGLNQLPPLSLYIHLPWCVKKCPYCDFNSHATAEDQSFPEKAYIDALIRDLEFDLPRIQGREISSIFIGGGTPSLFSAASLDRLLSALRARVALQPDMEITLEANPGTVDSGRFQDYRQIGINRLSIGIQSFDDAMLQRLGRIHNAKTAADAIRTARTAGFERINIDLMYGLPGQSLEQAMADIRQAMEYECTHLSWYQLTIEPNTVFYKNTPVLPEADDIWDMQERGQLLLRECGYAQYEISAYAMHGQMSRHNLNYWEFGDYLGIGAGAHGKLTHVIDHSVSRYVRHRIPDRYMQLAGTAAMITETRQLNENDMILEFMMNGLRLTGGVMENLFTERTGVPLDRIADRINHAVARGWLVHRNGLIIPTAAGRNYLNDLLQCFMSEETSGADKPERRLLA